MSEWVQTGTGSGLVVPSHASIPFPHQLVPVEPAIHQADEIIPPYPAELMVDALPINQMLGQCERIRYRPGFYSPHGHNIVQQVLAELIVNGRPTVVTITGPSAGGKDHVGEKLDPDLRSISGTIRDPRPGESLLRYLWWGAQDFEYRPPFEILTREDAERYYHYLSKHIPLVEWNFHNQAFYALPISSIVATFARTGGFAVVITEENGAKSISERFDGNNPDAILAANVIKIMVAPDDYEKGWPHLQKRGAAIDRLLDGAKIIGNYKNADLIFHNSRETDHGSRLDGQERFRRMIQHIRKVAAGAMRLAA